MELLPGLVLPRPLVAELVQAGQEGHRVALSHHNDPGSNGYTFGNDRYHRSCELARLVLERHGWTVKTHGAGYRASSSEGLELWLATARSADIAAPSSFDTGTDSRRNAAAINASLQPRLDGLDVVDGPLSQVVHLVYSGSATEGLVAVHVGRLETASEHSVRWRDVARVDLLDTGEAGRHEGITASGVPALRSYDQQPEPTIYLSATTRDQEREAENGAAIGS